MVTRVKHTESHLDYFITITCFNWLALFEITNAYDNIYKWFAHLVSKEILIHGYVIMPNHMHLLLNLNGTEVQLNHVIGTGKRLLAYHIVAKLKKQHDQSILNCLSKARTKHQISKGQKHCVFVSSFDVCVINSSMGIQRILDYMHLNPVKGKWQLVEDFRKYPHSSVGVYELDRKSHMVTKYPFF